VIPIVKEPRYRSTGGAANNKCDKRFLGLCLDKLVCVAGTFEEDPERLFNLSVYEWPQLTEDVLKAKKAVLAQIRPQRVRADPHIFQQRRQGCTTRMAAQKAAVMNRKPSYGVDCIKLLGPPLRPHLAIHDLKNLPQESSRVGHGLKIP
jgi:hypothetical protein